MNKVFGWMSLGLSVTALMTYLCGLFNVTLSGLFLIFWVIAAIAEIAIVLCFSVFGSEMKYSSLLAMFFGYSALTGITIAPAVFTYTAVSVLGAFITACATFGSMCVIGVVTKKDLSGWGSYLLMGLIGLIIATIVNIFLANSFVYWITTYIGLFIFMGLTIYDANTIKKELSYNNVDTNNYITLSAALDLYLDFVNMFLYILQLLGKSK